LLLVARAAQGFAAAGARVLVTSIVRDLFSGRAMAQVMSFAHVIFMAAPILAPLMGQGLIAIGPWRWIFGALCIIGAGVWFWTAMRMPETLSPDDRKSISWLQLRTSWGKVLADPQSRGYTVANAMLTGSTMSFLTSVQQIFADVFKKPELLPVGFGAMVVGMAIAQFANANLVMKLGMRRIGHAAIFFYTLMALIHLAVAWSGADTLWVFIGIQTLMMTGFCFAAGNFGALAMEHMGDVAGAASSLQGSFVSLIGMVVGAVVGQAFNGSTLPLTLGFVFCGTVAILAIFVTEDGRFFVPKNEPEKG
jgi:MFS transporter, DHA1 family, multidrug resistance protein